MKLWPGSLRCGEHFILCMLHFLIDQEIGTDAIELVRQFGKHCGKNVS